MARRRARTDLRTLAGLVADYILNRGAGEQVARNLARGDVQRLADGGAIPTMSVGLPTLDVDEASQPLALSSSAAGPLDLRMLSPPAEGSPDLRLLSAPASGSPSAFSPQDMDLWSKYQDLQGKYQALVNAPQKDNKNETIGDVFIKSGKEGAAAFRASPRGAEGAPPVLPAYAFGLARGGVARGSKLAATLAAKRRK